MIFDFESNQICYTTCQALLNEPGFNPIGQVPVALCRNDSVTIWYGRFSEILTFCCMSQLQRQETHTRNENCCNEVALYPMDLP